MDFEPKSLRSAADVKRGLRVLFGPEFASEFADSSGLTQVVAVTRASGSRTHVLRIGPQAPRSDVDWFVLNSVRAWAEVIFVGAQVLRSEPGLSYDLSSVAGWSGMAGALEAWRAALGVTRTRTLVVLSRSGDVPVEHPVWNSVTHAEIHTGPQGYARLEADAARAGVELWSTDAPSLSKSIAHLRSKGAARLSVEAGPGASGPLYADATEVDTVMRSVYRGSLDPAAVGPRFEAMDDLDQRYRRRCVYAESDEDAWRFEWWTRRSDAG